MIIAIDGPAGSGKSTVARRIARELGFLYVDTGAMYRALTWKALKEKIDLGDSRRLLSLARRTKISLHPPRGRKRKVKVLVDGKDVSSLIRRPSVTNNVSYLASLAGVRKILVREQRKFSRNGNMVMEGRDITTVVFPRAEKKFFLDACFKERVKRRYRERRTATDVESLKKNLRIRDKKDKTRRHGPLKRAKDAIYIDTTSLTISNVVNKILKEIRY